ncbi:MAG: peptidylprolyl isomerase [Spirochaetaceae bacterium]|jgi:hypothetical protein|nr:peptidylprolyl isomerase [Spirochaetaceae bacterium]
MSGKKSEKHNVKPATPEATEFERRFKQHPFVFIGTVIVLIIVIIAFVLVPAIVPGEGVSTQLDFGSWDKKPITYSSGGFFAGMREQYSRLAQYYQMSEYQIWRNAFESTVVRTAVLDIMDKSGYSPSKNFVDKRVAMLPQFQENGRFSAIKYNKLDAASRMKLWQDMSNDIIVERYHDDVVTIKSPDTEADFLGRMAVPQRRFRLAAFPYSMYPDEELVVYAGNNPNMFKTVYLSQITISEGEREAQAILDKIRSNEISFEDAARTQSEDTYSDRGGDTGARMTYELSMEIPDEQQRQSVINLAKGETSNVIKLPSGWGIYRANEPARPSDLQDASTLEKIRSFLMENERGVIEDWLISRAENFAQAARSGDFESAAARAGVSVETFGGLPINYGDSALFTTVSSFQLPVLNGVSVDENFWRTAFSIPVGEPSEPIVLSGNNDNIVILYADQEVIDDDSLIESSKTTFSGSWLENQTQRNITTSILTSKKFEDRFLNTYFRLFSGS